MSLHVNSQKKCMNIYIMEKSLKAEERADKEGWIFADNLEKELGVAD